MRRRFGASTEIHHERSKSTLREIRRLSDQVKRHLRSPPDCEGAAELLLTLAQQQGAYLIDRHEGGGRGLRTSYGGRGPRAIARKFISMCVVKPKSAAAARKMRAVWR